MKNSIVMYMFAFWFIALAGYSLFVEVDYSGVDSLQFGLLFYIIAEVRRYGSKI